MEDNGVFISKKIYSMRSITFEMRAPFLLKNINSNELSKNVSKEE